MRSTLHYFTCLVFSCALLSGCRENTPQKQAPQTAEPATTETQKPEEPKEKWPELGKVTAFFTAYGKENPETRVKLKTRLGDITLRLFEDTPLHRANFIHHIKRGLYYKTIFYRVMPDFMIQGGNSDNDQTLEKRENVGAYYIPSEVSPAHIHERGAVAMAMSYVNNPEMKSAQYSFYIVIGAAFTESGLKAVENEYDITIPASSRKVYTTIGGTPHLDGKHTVFGEVLDGMDVVEAIAEQKRDSGDWPINDVVIEYEILE